MSQPSEPIRFYNARLSLYHEKLNPNRPTINELYEKSLVGKEAKLSAPEIFTKRYLGVGCRYMTSIGTWAAVGLFGAYYVIQPNLPNLWAAIKTDIFFITPDEE